MTPTKDYCLCGSFGWNAQDYQKFTDEPFKSIKNSYCNKTNTEAQNQVDENNKIARKHRFSNQIFWVGDINKCDIMPQNVIKDLQNNISKKLYLRIIKTIFDS